MGISIVLEFIFVNIFRNKLKEQRECIITELLQTEKDYVADLKLLHQTFFSDPAEAQVSDIFEVIYEKIYSIFL